MSQILDSELETAAEPAEECFFDTEPDLERECHHRVLVPFWKRALDITCIILALPFLLAASAIIAIGIKLVSRGPVLFKQERIGLLGNRFLCLKFRTMQVNADTSIHQGHLAQLMSANSPMVKLDVTGDPRLIPGGRILRALGLDELPQVVNVLCGEMSLVGPRPCVPYEYEKYTARHRRRCETLPGLTGWWQVNGKNRTTFEQMMDLDLFYTQNKSLALDIKIIATTVPAIVGQVYDAKRKRKMAARRPLFRGLAVPLDPQY